MRAIDAVPRASHVVPLRSSGVKMPLFCIHGAGGAISGFERLTAAMPEDQPIYAFRPPRMDTVRDMLTVEDLAAMYIRDIRDIQKHGPYQLFGESFGGLVAFEIATRLVNEGESVQLLALLDICHPAHFRNLPQAKKKHFRFTYITDRVKKYALNVAGGRVDHIVADAFKFFGQRLQKIVWRICYKACRSLNLPMPSFLRTNILVFGAALERYSPPMYSGRVTLIRAGERTPEYDDDRTLGWQACVTGGIDVFTVPGDHIGIMDFPGVRSVGKILLTAQTFQEANCH